MPTAKNGFHILNLRPKKYVCIFKKKNFFLNANLLEKFQILYKHTCILDFTFDFSSLNPLVLLNNNSFTQYYFIVYLYFILLSVF